MIYCPEKYIHKVENVNERLLKLEGELPDLEARISLVDFLYANLGVTTHLFSGIELYPYQELILRTWFKRNFNLCVMGRGSAKTFIASVFCFLYPLFHPGAKIIIASPNFRTSRKIFNDVEKIVNSPEGAFLLEAFGVSSTSQMQGKVKGTRRNDIFEWEINGGSIIALPLTEKIRGFRANVLLVDEFLLVPPEIYENVLKPFLIVPQDLKQRIKTRKQEDRSIKDGLMTEKDRKIFKNQSKIIGLTSACYSFEYLYEKIYSPWRSIIENEDNKREEEVIDITKDPGESSYSISQMGWEALPPDMVDKGIIQEAQNGGDKNQVFQKEYCSIFIDGSESYYSAVKMYNQTIKAGELPCVELVGEPGARYILGIDPNASNSPAGDHFAMCVLKFDFASEKMVCVHNYAKAGIDLKDNIKYFHYLLKNFNVEFIIFDNAGGRIFCDAANETKEFINDNIKLSFLDDYNSNKSGKDYEENLDKMKKNYSKESGRMCIEQVFTSETIRNMNEYLQKCIDNKKLWFASPIGGNLTRFEEMEALDGQNFFDYDSVDEDNLATFCSTQDKNISLVKNECALIEISTSPLGNLTFDLPQSCKRNTSSTRPRKDSYTALLLARMGVKIYFEMLNIKQKPKSGLFTPRSFSLR